MSVETENGDQAGADTNAAEEAALAEALAGYNARGASAPPAGVPDTPEAQPDTPADAQLEPTPDDADPVDPPAAAPATPTLEDRLAAFREEVRAEAASKSAEEVRKLHGLVGDINRQLKQKADIPVEAPAPSPLDAALAEADRVAQEFPEIGGPLVAALRLATQSKPAEAGAPAVTQEQLDEQVKARAAALIAEREQAAYDEAVVALKAEHPDFATVKDSPEFTAWVKTKPADLQQVILNTSNPVLASKYLTEYRTTQNTKQKKQDRLASAITPTGVGAPAAPSQPTDVELAWAGYNGKGGPRQVKQR